MKKLILAMALIGASVAAHAEVPQLNSPNDPCSTLTGSDSFYFGNDNALRDMVYVNNHALIEGAAVMAAGFSTAKWTHSPNQAETYAAVESYCYAHPNDTITQSIFSFFNSLIVK
jgi:hypothetical protein